MANTNITKKLEERRNSLEIQNLKQKVIDFLNETNAGDEIRYRLYCDLSKKIDMPFYGDKKIRVKKTLNVQDIAKEYIRLLIQYKNSEFAEILLTWLTRQQTQTFRRIHKLSQKQKNRKKTLKNGVYEHPVPVAHSKKIILHYIATSNFEEACLFVDYLNLYVPQIFLTKTEDEAVNKISKESMPEGWNWKTDDVFIRYAMAHVDPNVYKE